jgi:hypothetical protein
LGVLVVVLVGDQGLQVVQQTAVVRTLRVLAWQTRVAVVVLVVALTAVTVVPVS